MKPHVLFDVLELITCLEKFLCLVDAGSQISEQLRRDRRRFDSMDFENLAELVKIADLLCRELTHVCAAPRFDNNKTLRFQPVKRLADRRFTDSELCCKRFFG